jgi:predicted MFS family arabinose efflux permease
VPLYYKNVWGFPEEMIGMLLALNPILIFLFEMVLVHRLSRPNPLRIIALGTLLCGLGLGMMPLGSGVAFALLTIVVWTVGEMFDQPFMGGFVAGRGGPASRGRYLGVYQLSFSVALVVSPVAGTAVYDGFGPRALWYGCGVAGALIALGYVAVSRAVEP